MFSQLEGGFMFEVPIEYARRLLAPPRDKGVVILGKHIPYEIAIGVNGKIWVNASSNKMIMIIIKS